MRSSNGIDPPKPKLIHKLLVGFVNLVTWVLRIIFPGADSIVTTRIDLTPQEFQNPDYKLPKDLKIVHLTDLHYDWEACPTRIPTARLEDMINKTNTENPDFIFITGDFVQKDPGPIEELCTRYLTRLKAKHGIYVTLGNHDYKRGSNGAAHITQILKKYNFKTIDNSVVIPLPQYPQLQIIGLGDLKSKGSWSPDVAFSEADKLAAQHDNKVYRLVLAHNPDSAYHINKHKVSLQFSGHSHGSQVVLPFIGPVVPFMAKFLKNYVPVKLQRFVPFYRFTRAMVNWDLVYGLHKIDRPNSDEKNLVWVSAGLATHPPARLLCPPEVAVITLSSSTTSK